MMLTSAGYPAANTIGDTMSSKNLNDELATLDDEIERLETRRTAIIGRMETSGRRRIQASNVIRFNNSSRIMTSRPAVNEWLSVLPPIGSGDRD
jgi:hypothetical protein